MDFMAGLATRPMDQGAVHAATADAACGLPGGRPDAAGKPLGCPETAERLRPGDDLVMMAGARNTKREGWG